MFNAFSMNCVSHLQHGLWTRPDSRQLEYKHLDPWIDLAKTLEKGLLMVHTGKGKGKSTAAFGLVARAIGNGLNVGVVQYVKGKWQTGERGVLEKFADQVTIRTMGEGFTWETQDKARDIRAAENAWAAQWRFTWPGAVWMWLFTITDRRTKRTL